MMNCYVILEINCVYIYRLQDKSHFFRRVAIWFLSCGPVWLPQLPKVKMPSRHKNLSFFIKLFPWKETVRIHGRIHLKELIPW